MAKPLQLEADASFDDIVLKSDVPVLVDFHARYVKCFATNLVMIRGGCASRMLNHPGTTVHSPSTAACKYQPPFPTLWEPASVREFAAKPVEWIHHNFFAVFECVVFQ